MIKSSISFLFFLIGYSYSVIIQTEYGKIRGISTSLGTEFLSIPYAKPPIGKLRWKEPQPPTSWDGIRDSMNAPKYKCIQPTLPVWSAKDTVDSSEDCLQLNIFVPSLTFPLSTSLPVMVWFPGGIYLIGSIHNPLYNASILATQGKKAIIVTVNSRLGLFGYLAHPKLSKESSDNTSGNYGFLDQQFALKWIQRNIKFFGGDSSRVTIFGQSSGGVSSMLHYLSPTSANLFHGVISIGATLGFPLLTIEEAYKKRGQFIEIKLNCSSTIDDDDNNNNDDNNILDCLRNKSTEEINSLSYLFLDGLWDLFTTKNYIPFYLETFGPIVDNVHIYNPDLVSSFQNFKQSISSSSSSTSTSSKPKIPLILGFTRDESSILSSRTFYALPYRTYEQIILHTWKQEYYKNILNSYKSIMNQYGNWASLVNISTDNHYKCPGYNIALSLTDVNIPVFIYRMDGVVKSGRDSPWQAYHGSDFWYIFQNENLLLPNEFDEDDYALSKELTGSWIDFAHKLGTDTSVTDIAVNKGTKDEIIWKPILSSDSTPTDSLTIPTLIFQLKNRGGSQFVIDQTVCNVWDNMYENLTKTPTSQTYSFYSTNLHTPPSEEPLLAYFINLYQISFLPQWITINPNLTLGIIGFSVVYALISFWMLLKQDKTKNLKKNA